MAQKEYTLKTTKEQYNKFKTDSRNAGQLLHFVYMNETDVNLPFPKFISLLATWMRRVHRTDTRTGVQKINKYLDSKFA